MIWLTECVYQVYFCNLNDRCHNKLQQCARKTIDVCTSTGNTRELVLISLVIMRYLVNGHEISH